MLKCAVQRGQEQNWPSWACLWKAATPGLPSLGAKAAPGAAGWQGLCYCQCFVTLLLSKSCFMWQMTHRKYKCCLQSLCLKKTAMSKYYVFLCLYNSFNLSVCKAYEGETNHSSLKHTYPHWSCGAAWYGEAKLSYFLPGFLFSQDFHSYFKHAGEGFSSWGWSNIDQVSQQGSIISILGDPQNLTGCEPEQPALLGPSLRRE